MTGLHSAQIDSAQQDLARIWQRLFGVDDIAFDQNYFDLGGDSSLAVQMFAQIEQAFDVKLPLATLYEAPTIAELAEILCGGEAATGWSPLVEIQPLGSRIPFFCFHGAGGNVLSYRKLSQYLGVDQPFYGLQAQGLDGGARPLESIEEMAALYVKEIRKVQPRGPYLLGGYCMGGTIAYEVARQLQSSGEAVALLALCDTMNWHKVPLSVWSKSSYACQRFVFHAASFLDLDSPGKAKFFGEKVDVLRRRIPVWRGMLRASWLRGRRAEDGNDSSVLARVWKTNDEAAWKYVPKPYAGKLVDIRPVKQYRVFRRPDLKWEKLALSGQTVEVLPVYPAGMLLEPFVKYLAAALRKHIDQAIGKAPFELQEARVVADR